MTKKRDLDKAALRGEPSYVWRDGQRRRLRMILEAAGERVAGRVLVDGCGIGMYLYHLSKGQTKSSDWTSNSHACKKQKHGTET